MPALEASAHATRRFQPPRLPYYNSPRVEGDSALFEDGGYVRLYARASSRSLNPDGTSKLIEIVRMEPDNEQPRAARESGNQGRWSRSIPRLGWKGGPSGRGTERKAVVRVQTPSWYTPRAWESRCDSYQSNESRIHSE